MPYATLVSVADLKESAVNTDVWLVPAAGGSPLRLTGSPQADGQPRWSPDGKTIAFISAREERPQIWLISPFGGAAEKVGECGEVGEVRRECQWEYSDATSHIRTAMRSGRPLRLWRW